MFVLKVFSSNFQAFAEARIDDKVMADGYGKKICYNNLRVFWCPEKY